jgi:hypothetical protein
MNSSRNLCTTLFGVPAGAASANQLATGLTQSRLSQGRDVRHDATQAGVGVDGERFQFLLQNPFDTV